MIEENEILDISELIPGVILMKELKKIENTSNNDIIGIMIYKIQLARMNILNLDIDFTSSNNVKINNKKYKKIKISIMPFETKIIAEIYLENDFKISPKFTFNFFIPEKKIQIKYLQQYEEEKINSYEIIKREIYKYPFEFMDLDEINDILLKLNINFIDLDFIHNEKSLVNNNNYSDLSYIIHWRRPQDFLINKNYQKMSEVDYNSIEIMNRKKTPFVNDIKQGLIPNNNLVCVLNALTEKNNLINKLIINKNINQNGIYKIKLCIKGEWITVTIDDYFPCIPFSNPVVLSTFSNDLWVLLIEKALAKTFGNYFNLININISQYLSILTGCPTISLNITDIIDNTKDIQHYYQIIDEYLHKKNYLMIAISNKINNNLSESDLGYTILNIINKNNNYFIVLRINIFDKKYEKIREIYLKKLNKKYPELMNEYNNEKNILILFLEDFLKEFRSIEICYTQKWEDIRIRGKFVDIGNDNNILIVSKCFYNINLERETNIIISLFQDDDEFIFDKNISRKNKLDISLSIIRQDTENNEITLIKTYDFSFSSSIQMEIKLPPGNYIIFPRTSGCIFGRINSKNNNLDIPLFDSNNNQLADIFINTIKDIFKKFDILLNRYLGYKEFKGFWECVQNDKTINEKYFNNNILNRYQCYSHGITEKGFIDFFKDIYISKNGKEEIYNWLNKLGYDKDLYPLKSRCFMITFQTEFPIKVSVYNTLNTNLYSKIERLILFSKGNIIKEKGEIIILQYKSSYNYIFSVGAINKGNKNLIVEIKIKKNNGIIISDKRNKIEKLIEPGKSEFYFYYLINDIHYFNNSKNGKNINYNNIIDLDIDYYSLN